MVPSLLDNILFETWLISCHVHKYFLPAWEANVCWWPNGLIRAIGSCDILGGVLEYLTIFFTHCASRGWSFKGILWDFVILTLEQIIVLNKYCTYNKPIPKYHMPKHYKTTSKRKRWIHYFIFKHRLGLKLLWNLKDCLVSCVGMHICKKSAFKWQKKVGFHWQSPNNSFKANSHRKCGKAYKTKLNLKGNIIVRWQRNK